MKHLKHALCGILAVGSLCACPISTLAADHNFSTQSPTGYYKSTAYEEVYGLQYNYGDTNALDCLQSVSLPFGTVSTARTGVMEKPPVIFTAPVAAPVSGSETIYVSPAVSAATAPVLAQPAYTSVEGMKRSDGSIGTITIPSLNMTRKVWEGETTASMSKGVGHYSSTSGWDGNVGVCGHNRGSTYVIGAIKDLKVGDTITYTTVYGTRTYKVALVKTISNTDWSYLQATADNRLTLTTCLADHPESRVCVQAVEG